MTFPNAAKGLKKIYSAEILALVAALCSGIILIVTAFTVASAEDGSVAGALTGVAIIGLFGLGALVLLILALIFNLIGISSAKKDETGDQKGFATAFICIICSLIAGVVAGFFTTSIPALATGLTTASKLLDLIATYYVLYGIADFADKLGDSDLAAKSRGMAVKLCVLYCVSIIANAVTSFLSGKLGTIVALLLALVVLLFSVVYYIMYLRTLKTAKEVFASK